MRESALGDTEGLRVAIDSKVFGGRQVLAGVRFAAGPGEVLAVLAPSGTGKTTALRIVLGLDRAFSGKVERPPGRAGVVFQDPRLLPWLDVSANLRLVAPGLGQDGIAACLALAGVPDVADMMPKALSLGTARRVALARALSVKPRLLVLDEPFVSLDAQIAGTLARDVSAYGRRLGAVTLIATHDLAQAIGIADRILVLGGGPPATVMSDTHVSSNTQAILESRFPFLVAKHTAA